MKTQWPFLFEEIKCSSNGIQGEYCKVCLFLSKVYTSCDDIRNWHQVNRAIEFIETSIFTKQVREIATDDELKDLQIELIAQPEKGDLITGTGGLRKVRMATGTQGKSGSTRVIYFLATAEIIYLVLAYPKNAKDNLSNAEKAELKKLVKLLKGEV